MTDIIIGLEAFVQWLVDWWHNGGAMTLAITVISSPFFTLAIRFLLIPLIQKRIRKKKARKRAERDREDAEAAGVTEFLSIMQKELPRHD